ncbi:MAG: hypothetical protein K2W78_03195 [Xanthobacteraceae bacterium]|nr:hypothetical protein [Xanthobacteraceae bacterium]
MNRYMMTSPLPGWLRAAIYVGVLANLTAGAPVFAQEQAETAPASSPLPDPSTLDWSQLDTSNLPAFDKAIRTARPITQSGTSANWNRTVNNDGAAAVTVKDSVSPFWNTQVGADLNVANNAPLTAGEVLARKAIGDSPSFQSTGSAWASATAPGFGLWDKTSIDARLDPSSEQSKVGTTISKIVPLGSQSYAVTIQGTYNVIESAVPLVGATGRPTNSAEQFDRSAKLELKDTGTSLLAGESLSTIDDKWLRRIGAEQKLFGGVSITGALSQTADGSASKSLTAGYKYNW